MPRTRKNVFAISALASIEMPKPLFERHKWLYLLRSRTKGHGMTGKVPGSMKSIRHAANLKKPKTMLIKTAEFVKSCPGLASCPCSEKPEYAFIGRSNVGKSSLINMISARKGLAMTSSKPGKTLLINYFDINNSWYLVDLPGYGFASVDKDTRARLKRMIEEYTVGRMQLTNLFVLLDCRLEPQKNDLDFINFLGGHEVPFSLVFTKTDKISKSKLAANIAHYKEVLSGQWEWLPPIFATSSETKEGRDELLSYIEQINNSLENQE